MAIAIDFSTWRPSVEQLKAAGVTIVIRYLSFLPNGKVILEPELLAYIAAGIAVVFVWEVSETSWLGGNPVGQTHGREARRQLRALGVPDSIPVLVAFDYNVEPFQLPLAREYQRGFKQWAGVVGVYGTGLVINDFFELGIASYAMQTNARGWIGNRDDNPHAGLIQHYGSQIKGLVPVDYDVNTITAVDVGQHPRPSAQAPEPPSEEDNRMLSVIGVTPIDDNHNPVIVIDPTDPTKLLALYCAPWAAESGHEVVTAFACSTFQLHGGKAVKLSPRPDGVAVLLDTNEVHVAALSAGHSVA